MSVLFEKTGGGVTRGVRTGRRHPKQRRDGPRPHKPPRNIEFNPAPPVDAWLLKYPQAREVLDNLQPGIKERVKAPRGVRTKLNHTWYARAVLDVLEHTITARRVLDVTDDLPLSGDYVIRAAKRLNIKIGLTRAKQGIRWLRAHGILTNRGSYRQAYSKAKPSGWRVRVYRFVLEASAPLRSKRLRSRPPLSRTVREKTVALKRWWEGPFGNPGGEPPPKHQREMRSQEELETWAVDPKFRDVPGVKPQAGFLKSVRTYVLVEAT